MNNVKLEVFDQALLLLFDELSGKQQKKAFKSALTKSLGIITKEAKRNLKSKLGAAATHVGKKYGKRLTSGIRTRVAKSARSGKVHIMGDYRLKWFEMGTRERHLRKNLKNRGTIKPLYFFKAAVESKKAEAQNSLEKMLTDSIIKVYKKHK